MASTLQIYGQLGAAKAFTSSVSPALDINIEANEAQIKELQEQLSQTKDETQKKKINKKIKRLQRKNKVDNGFRKANESATEFLVKLAELVDIGIKELIEWVANFIVMYVPILETVVKIALLANIKKMVSCTINPAIPDVLREEGFIFNEKQIDPRQILSSSPYSKWGKYCYFGCYNDSEYTDPKIVFELSRADDMNAFMWFTKNCARFVNPTIIPIGSMSDYFNVTNDKTFYNETSFSGRSDHRYVEGSSFKHSANSDDLFLCQKRTFDENGGVTYTIVPVTSNVSDFALNFATWYKTRTSITGLEKNYPENPNAKPLFVLEYGGSKTDVQYYRDDNFRFKILQKPFSVAGGFIAELHNEINRISDIVGEPVTELIGTQLSSQMPNYTFTGIQAPFAYVARFNRDGQYSKRGKYSINLRKNSVQQTGEENGYIIFDVTPLSGGGQGARMKLNKANKQFSLEPINGNGQLDYSELLSECYFGKTIYEFNYDYVTSAKLFEAKSIAVGIIDALMHINIPIPDPFKRNRDTGDAISNLEQIKINSYVDKLVEKMIDTEEREFTDCFYTFSNEDYEAMEQAVADKLANETLTTFDSENAITEVYNEIDAYDADATLNKRKETISNAIYKAANACGFDDGGNELNNDYSQSGYPKSSTGRHANAARFFLQLIQFLISTIVNALLTPKVLMLIQVNRMLMGTSAFPTSQKELKDKYTYDVSDVLESLSFLVKGLIREVVNIIHKELLRLILERIAMIMAGYLKKLGLEYAMKWANLLRMIIACFKRNKNKLNIDETGQYYDSIQSIIDNVDYADIDATIDEIMPNTNPC